MTSTTIRHAQNLATFIHLSTFAKYFIPLGNFILPLLMWTFQKKNSPFVDLHGRQAINFQISMLIYNIGLFLLALPFIGWQIISLIQLNITINLEQDYGSLYNILQASGLLITFIILGILFLALFIIELVAVISAASQANKGLIYRYPLCIPFLKSNNISNNHSTQASSTC